MIKVLVGLSGGVDSAVAAYLLKKSGYDVTCCFMRNWDSAANQDIAGNPTLNAEICSQELDFNDAKKAADILGLPLLRVDFIDEYWNYVFKNFLDEYKLGRTPNPDILCNKYIKFSSFWNYAKEQGFDYIATGHYAKVKDGRLYQAKDKSKDQTYFLDQVNKEVLKEVLFPLGDYLKSEVRSIAVELNLNVALKKDSTGICFIGERKFQEFLSNYLLLKKGKIIDIATQKVLGEHTGVLYYTLGQRKGLGIGGDKGPWYVIGKDLDKNVVYVSNEEKSYWSKSDACSLINVNFFEEICSPLVCQAKFRYRQKSYPVTLYKKENTVYLKFNEIVEYVTPGQQAVLYVDDLVVGGGEIDVVYFEEKTLEARIEEYVN